MRKLVQAILLVPIALAVLLPAAARADEVTDWNQTFFRAALIGASTPLVVTRQAAIVQASVFDAVNGIGRHVAQYCDVAQSSSVDQYHWAVAACHVDLSRNENLIRGGDTKTVPASAAATTS